MPNDAEEQINKIKYSPEFVYQCYESNFELDVFIYFSTKKQKKADWRHCKQDTGNGYKRNDRFLLSR